LGFKFRSLWQIISVRDNGILWAVPQFGTVSVADALNVLVVFALDTFGIVLGAEFFGGIVAVLLESMNLGGETAKYPNEVCISLRVLDELLVGVGLEQHLGDLSGSELEADLGESAGVGFPEVLGEIVLEQAGFQRTILCKAPFLVTAAGFPVGYIAFGDANADFIEGTDDFRVGQVVAEHAIDHVALEVREPRDFAVATHFSKWGYYLESGWQARWDQGGGLR
jgi:hypothetical protein